MYKFLLDSICSSPIVYKRENCAILVSLAQRLRFYVKLLYVILLYWTYGEHLPGISVGYYNLCKNCAFWLTCHLKKKCLPGSVKLYMIYFGLFTVFSIDKSLR